MTEWDLMDKSLLLETDYAAAKITMNKVHKKINSEIDQEEFLENLLAAQEVQEDN